MQDDHKLIAWMRDFAKDESQLTDQAIINRFAYLDDKTRTAELQNMGGWINDSSSLRQNSQLLKLGRELNHLHQAMRRAGR